MSEMAVAIRTRCEAFCRLLGISRPVLGAPMPFAAGPKLVAAVSNAGGLGCLAGDFLSVGQLREAVNAVRNLTNRPFAVNLRVPPRDPDSKNAMLVSESLAQLREDLGIDPDRKLTELPDFDMPFRTLIELRVPVIRLAMGGPREIYRDLADEAGIRIIAAATTLREAKVLAASHVDAVIVQGIEAGGPRLSFEDPDTADVGLLSLITPAARATRLPVIASGGIMTREQAFGCFAAGASGVEIGTALLRSDESLAGPVYRQALEFSSDTKTSLSRLPEGRLARMLGNDLFDVMRDAELESAGYPGQLCAMLDIYDAAQRLGREELMPLYAGAGSAMARPGAASELVAGIDPLAALC